MMVYLGETNSRPIRDRLNALGWGRMIVHTDRQILDGEIYALDNGAFGDWRNGVSFDGDAFLDRVEYFRLHVPHPPDFVVVPDVVGGGMVSLEMSLAWKEKLHSEGVVWPLYLAVQDGMSCEAVESAMVGFDGLFLGGTSEFKLRAAEFESVAHGASKPCHYGRCGTPNKVAHAKRCGYDSLDSSFPLWSVDRMDGFIQAVEGNLPQIPLFS